MILSTAGEKQQTIAIRFGVADWTILAIKKKAQYILKGISDFTTTKNKKITECVENEVKIWYDTMKRKIVPLSGPILPEKACKIAEE